MILCIMRLPPAPTGHGGSQRAWAMLQALAALGPVDFVLVHRETDADLDGVSLEPLRSVARSVTLLPLPEWTTTKARFRWVPWRIGVWIDMLRFGADEAPRFGRRTLRRIAANLPVRDFRHVFAGRLPCAAIADLLLNAGLITAQGKFVDFDDVVSRFKEREVAAHQYGLLRRLRHAVDIALVRRSEMSLAQRWDAVSVCSREDVALLRGRAPRAAILEVPNVIDRPVLPLRQAADFNILFVGNLSFPPNVHGLQEFVAAAWPSIAARYPGVRLTVVGMRPPQALRDGLEALGIAVHANAPSVEPFYRDCDAVICPIAFGGGTRIKLLEAMAYGRPIVSTIIGAEGLGLVSGEHALLTGTIAAFSDALIRLIEDPGLREALAANARRRQQESFGPRMLRDAIHAMLSVPPQGSALLDKGIAG